MYTLSLILVFQIFISIYLSNFFFLHPFLLRQHKSTEHLYSFQVTNERSKKNNNTSHNRYRAVFLTHSVYMVVVSFRPFAKRVHSTNVKEEKNSSNKSNNNKIHTHTHTHTHRVSVRLFPKKKQTIKIWGIENRKQPLLWLK